MAPTNRRSQSFTCQTETKQLNLIFTEFREALSSTKNREASMLSSLTYMSYIQVTMKVNFANTYARQGIQDNSQNALTLVLKKEHECLVLPLVLAMTYTSF